MKFENVGIYLDVSSDSIDALSPDELKASFQEAVGDTARINEVCLNFRKLNVRSSDS